MDIVKQSNNNRKKEISGATSERLLTRRLRVSRIKPGEYQRSQGSTVRPALILGNGTKVPIPTSGQKIGQCIASSGVSLTGTKVPVTTSERKFTGRDKSTRNKSSTYKTTGTKVSMEQKFQRSGQKSQPQHRKRSNPANTDVSFSYLAKTLTKNKEK